MQEKDKIHSDHKIHLDSNVIQGYINNLEYKNHKKSNIIHDLSRQVQILTKQNKILRQHNH